jgi:eukaryotic-like serine/threonine-protein kinase
MTSMLPCPSDHTLRKLALDSLDLDALAEIDAHIEACNDCKKRLGRLVRQCPSTETEAPNCLPEKACPPTIPGFEIERELGRGAMGVVYLARDQKLGRHVALKVMPGAQSADGQARKRWRTEAQAFSRVRHPNVVSLYEIGETDSWLFLVLEYIPGGTLKKRLAGPVSQGVAVGLVAKIATAVQTIHSAKLLHLDLKPSNILVDSAEDAPLDRVTPKVADFGIARIMPRDEADPAQTGTTLMGPWGGTASYMAPEQITGARSELDPGADIRALGAILYELLTGRPPFQGDSALHTLDMVRETEAVSPRRINPHVSRDLETITLKCLQKEPKRRYASAQAVAEDLTRHLENRPILARPVSRPELAWRWCRRRPALATSLAALVTTVLFGITALHTLYARAIVERDRAEGILARELKHREIASVLIPTLQGIVDEALVGLPLQGERLENTAMSLRAELAKARTIAGFGHIYRADLDWTGHHLAWRFAQSGRLNEARAIMRDRLAFFQQCRDHDPVNRDQLWRFVDACVSAARFEDQAERPIDALGFLDRAAYLVKTAGRDDPWRPVFATSVSEMYRQLQNEPALVGCDVGFRGHVRHLITPPRPCLRRPHPDILVLLLSQTCSQRWVRSSPASRNRLRSR